MTIFKVGDRVKVIAFPDDGVHAFPIVGKTGAICKIHEEDYLEFPLEVDFDVPIPGYSGLLFAEDELELEYSELAYDPLQQPDLDEDI